MNKEIGNEPGFLENQFDLITDYWGTYSPGEGYARFSEDASEALKESIAGQDAYVQSSAGSAWGVTNLAGSIGAGFFEWGARVAEARLTTGSMVPAAVVLVKTPVEGMIGGGLSVYGKGKEWVNEGIPDDCYDASREVTETLGTAVLLVGGARGLARGVAGMPALLADGPAMEMISPSPLAETPTVIPKRTVIDLAEDVDGIWRSSHPVFKPALLTVAESTENPSSATVFSEAPINSWPSQNARIAGAFRNIEEMIRPMSEEAATERTVAIKEITPVDLQVQEIVNYQTGRSPSGFQITLAEGTDIVQTALQVLTDTSREAIPNNRIVFHTQGWTTALEMTLDLTHTLQTLAEQFGVTVCLKTSNPDYLATEFEPATEVARQQTAGPMAAAKAKQYSLIYTDPLAEAKLTLEESKKLASMKIYQRDASNSLKVFKAAQEAGLSNEKTLLLLELIEQKAGKNSDPLLYLRQALLAARRAGFSPSQTVDLLQRLIQKAESDPGWSLYELSNLIDGGIKTGLSREQITTLLDLCLEKTAPGENPPIGQIARDLGPEFCTLTTASNVGFSPEQITDLLAHIIKNSTTGKEIDESLLTLRTDILPWANIHLIEFLARKGQLTHENINTLNPAWLAAEKAGYSIYQITSLINQIDTMNNLFVLPDALEAGLTPDQIVTLFEQDTIRSLSIHEFPYCDALRKVFEKITDPESVTIKQITNSFVIEYVNELNPDAVSSTKKLGLTEEEIAVFFEQIVNQTGKVAPFAFHALPVALEGGLKPGQITQLLSKYPDRIQWAFENTEFPFVSLTPEGEILHSKNIIPTPGLVAMYTPGIESEWATLLEHIGNGQERFNPKDSLHVELVYTTFHQGTQLIFSNPDKYDYRLYKEIIATATNDNEPAPLTSDQKAELVYSGYEAYLLYQELQALKKVAEREGRKILVVPNYSYGRFVVEPLEKYLKKDPVFQIVPARIGSTESHHNEWVLHSLKADRIFDEKTERMILEEQPLIVMLDGSNSFSNRRLARYPDAQKGYVNFAITVNDTLEIPQGEMYRSPKHLTGLRATVDYDVLKIRLLSYGIKNNAAKPYQVYYWNPAGTDLAISEGHHGTRQAVAEVPSARLDNIKGPALIVVNSVFNDGYQDVHLPDWVKAMGGGHQHEAAYFDDTHHIQNILFKVGPRGIEVQDQIYGKIRDQFRRFLYRDFYERVAATGLVTAEQAMKMRLHRLFKEGDVSDEQTFTLQEQLKEKLEKQNIILSDDEIARITESLVGKGH